MAVFVGPSFCTPKRRADLQDTTAACISAILRKTKGGQPAPADAHSGITWPVAGRFDRQGLKGERFSPLPCNVSCSTVCSYWRVDGKRFIVGGSASTWDDRLAQSALLLQAPARTPGVIHYLSSTLGAIINFDSLSRLGTESPAGARCGEAIIRKFSG